MDKEYHNNYLRHVTALGDSHDVLTHEDIYAQNGIKLVNKNARINRHLYENLIHHKLLKPIDFSLTINNAVSANSLFKEAKRLIETEPCLKKAVDALNDQELPLRIMSAINLPSPLAFKLTVLRERSLKTFQHSIRVALVSIFLGDKAGFDRDTLNCLATAGMFHDVGILHLNEELLDSSRKFTDQDRHNLYAHPLLGSMILEQFPEYHPSISQAVLDHHERLDGSGYPRGLTHEDISELGKVLAIVELATGFLEKYTGNDAAAKLQVILKFNSTKYSADLTRHLLSLYKAAEMDTAERQITMESLATDMKSVSSILQHWKQFNNNDKADGQNINDKEVQELIDDRIQELEHNLMHVGMRLEDFPGIISQIQNDPQSLNEVSLLKNEMVYQVKSLLEEVERHLEKHTENYRERDCVLTKWLEKSKTLLF
ncbi:HD-GYP domain-containing protein [Sulfuriflexus mobilis]|uniref:HD-GYP domain-containing protein n=1 Tax=Sulfuriflexus mobilis TaxID=1811807 RepID=UPI000F8492ED|nr:HD domain-containing phosphohydrolase [Sulfuriflexus mobilis]